MLQCNSNVNIVTNSGLDTRRLCSVVLIQKCFIARDSQWCVAIINEHGLVAFGRTFDEEKKIESRSSFVFLGAQAFSFRNFCAQFPNSIIADKRIN